MQKIKLKTKLITSFVLIILVAVIVIGTVVLTSMKAATEQEIRKKLLLLSEAKEGQVFAYLDSLELRTLDFSSGVIRDSLVEIENGGNAAEILNRLSEHLINSKKPLDPNLIDIDVLDRNGVVIASTNPNEIGRDKKEDACFLKGRNGLAVIDPDKEEYPDTSLVVLEAAAPLVDLNSQEFLGVVVNVFNTEKLDSILSGLFQIEKGALVNAQSFIDASSLSVHLVDKKNKILAHGHEAEQHLVSTIDTFPTQKCFADGKEVVGTYTNHFGKEVVGVSACLPARGWVLLTEINIEEAFAPVKNTIYGLVIMLLIFAFFVILEIFLIASRITGPIKRLHEAADIIAGGNLDYRVNIRTGDEVEQLGESFNKMVASLSEDKSRLKQYAVGLDRMVSEKTKELGDKMVDLEKMNELMSGRELKMIELKKRIKELETEKEESLKKV